MCCEHARPAVDIAGRLLALRVLLRVAIINARFELVLACFADLVAFRNIGAA